MTDVRPSAPKRVDLVGGQLPAVAVVAGRAALGARLLAALLELLGRAVAAVGGTVLRAAAQRTSRYRSRRSDCRYGPNGPPTSGPSSQSRPSQRRDARSCVYDSSVSRCGVGVLDAEHERARRGGGRTPS